MGTPGRAVMWTNADVSSRRADSTAADAEQVITRSSSFLDNKEMTIVFTSESSSPVFSHESIHTAVNKATEVVSYPHIYLSAATPRQSIEDSLDAKLQLEPTTLDSLMTMTQHCESTCILNDKVHNAYKIALTNSKEESAHLKHFMSIAASIPISFIALEEPSPEAFLTDLAPAMYRHLLANDSSVGYNTISGNGTVVDSALLYKPEGAEYSIYYANTYLYITPDIFTGLFTGLFIFFVALTGINCLGSIQGPASFATKSPPVGKEG